MSKLVLNNVVFRLLGPVLSGTVIYLLVLLINNNIGQLITHFFSEELLVCVAISIVVFELIRLFLIRSNKVRAYKNFIRLLTTRMLFALLITLVVVTTLVSLYYKLVLGFTPNAQELLMFNSIFCVFAFAYVLVSANQQQLQNYNLHLIRKESLRQKMAQEDFSQFVQELNPNFLFVCLEKLISLIRQNDQLQNADKLLQHLAKVYRHTLSGKQEQLVAIEDEIMVLNEFVELLNQLPNNKVRLVTNELSGFLCIPGGLIKIMECIVNGTIQTSDEYLKINIKENEDALVVDYITADKLKDDTIAKEIEVLNDRYKIYSDNKITINDSYGVRLITIPKLKPMV